MSRPDVLFSTYGWDTVLDAQRAVLRAQVHGLTADYLKDRDPEALAAVFAEEHGLAPPIVFPDRLAVAPARACVTSTRISFS